MWEWVKYVRYKEESLKSRVSWTFGGTDTGLTVSGWFVRKWELSQISSDHVELDFNGTEDFTAVNSNKVTNHFWHNDAISKMSLNYSWLFSCYTVLLSLLALVVKSVVSVLDFSGESSSLSGSEEFNDLLSGKSVNLLWSISSEWILLKSSLFFLCNCGHLSL